VLRDTVSTIQAELGGSAADVCKIVGLLLLWQHEVDERQAVLERLDFRSQDLEQTRRVEDELDDEIAALNRARYSLTYNRRGFRPRSMKDVSCSSPMMQNTYFVKPACGFWMPNERYPDQQASGVLTDVRSQPARPVAAAPTVV
jgi:hypothetical protein